MPRATFGGITFDLLVQGLQDTHEGFTTVREVPGGPGYAYVDLGGPLIPRRTVNVLLDNEAQYLRLAALPGTAMARAVLLTDDGEQPAVLVSVSRYLRRGGPLPQLCRTEWLLLPPEPLPLQPPAPPTLDGAAGTGWELVELDDRPLPPPGAVLGGTGWRLLTLLSTLPVEGTGWELVELEEEVPLETTAWELVELDDA